MCFSCKLFVANKEDKMISPFDVIDEMFDFTVFGISYRDFVLILLLFCATYFLYRLILDLWG